MNTRVIRFHPPIAKPAPAPHINLGDALQRLTNCADWLTSKGITLDRFAASTMHPPVIHVAAAPRVWMLFSGVAYNRRQRRNGAKVTHVWEAIDAKNDVTIRWEETSCA